MKNQKIQNTIENGIERINQIKKEITSYKPPKLCKAEVYEMWDELETDK